MSVKKRKTHLMRQVAGLFLVGIVMTGIFTFIMMYLDTNRSVKSQAETHAKEISNEVALAIREYPACKWLLQYWYDHTKTLEIEYDVTFTEADDAEQPLQTKQKSSLFSERHPNIQLRYATEAQLKALPPEDQKLYAEIAYSWLITRVNQIKRTYPTSFLFCVATDETFGTQVFLFSAADEGAKRGTKYEEVYPLGHTVDVDQSQKEAMCSAFENSSHSSELADAGKYMDFYAYFDTIGDGHHVLIGLTYDLQSDIMAQARRGTIFSVAHQFVLSVLCLGVMVFLVLLPLKKVQKSIRHYMQNKDSAEVIKHLSKLKSRNEIGQLSEDTIEMVKEIDNYLGEIQLIAAEKERIGTELSIASQIQEGSVPTVFPAYPDRAEFDIYASMTTAKEVGGDFYDFYLIDDDHLALVMADVSGKGVPAALFMMVTKILISDRALMGGTPGEILTFVNDRLCENNDADMFVTVWMGILEISTGKIIAANAGHDDPAICRKGGRFEIAKSRHGMVIGAMSGMKYRDYDFCLAPGDKLFLYTDGVPEATDANNQMLTLDGMLQALNLSPAGTPDEILNTVRARVDAFAGDAPQFDDMTMLCLEMKEANESVQTLKVEASTDNLAAVTDFVDAFLEAHGCPMKAQMQIDLCVEEVFVNIANYAYSNGGDAEIRLHAKDGEVTLTFFDTGTPYDPLAKADPDITLSAEDRQIGGLGIFLVKKNMDAVSYRRENGKNILTMKKRIHSEGGTLK